MKRISFLVLLFWGASIIWGNASAQTSKTEDGKVLNVQTNQNQRGNFIDANKDGLCDNYQENGNGRNFVDKDGDGICDNSKDRNSRGFGKNRNNYKAHRNGKGMGRGMRKGQCRRNGRGDL